MLKRMFMRYLRQELAKGNCDEIMLEVVGAAKALWYEDNVFTVKSELETHLHNALGYEYHILNLKNL